MHGLGRRFRLPEISRDDWYSGLRERFERCGIAIERNELQQIVYHSEGHPLRTMLICAHTLDWLFEGTVTVDTASVRSQTPNATPPGASRERLGSPDPGTPAGG